MGGEAAMQILRLPSVLIHIPECSPGENLVLDEYLVHDTLLSCSLFSL